MIRTMLKWFPTQAVLLLLSAGLVLLFPSCRATNQLLKAGPAKLSLFMEHQEEMVDPRKTLPFQKLWKSPDKEVWARAEEKKNIYVAPVTVEYLRPVKKNLVKEEIAMGILKRREKEMAKLLQDTFVKVLEKAPNPRYKVVKAPDDDSVTLEMALVELNPTSVKGNVVVNGLNFVIGPLAYLGAYFTKGNIAFEAKLRNSKTGEPFLEFTDNEEDPLTIYSIRDFSAYGHASNAVTNWAKQFEKYTRNPPGKKIRESPFINLNPF